MCLYCEGWVIICSNLWVTLYIVPPQINFIIFTSVSRGSFRSGTRCPPPENSLGNTLFIIWKKRTWKIVKRGGGVRLKERGKWVKIKKIWKKYELFSQFLAFYPGEGGAGGGIEVSPPPPKQNSENILQNCEFVTFYVCMALLMMYISKYSTFISSNR